MGIPMLPPLIGLTAGILLADSGGIPLWGGVVLALLAVAAGLFLSLRGKGPLEKLRIADFGWYWIFPLFIAVGIISGSLLLHESAYEHPRFDGYVSSLGPGSRVVLHLRHKSTGSYGDRWLCEADGFLLPETGLIKPLRLTGQPLYLNLPVGDRKTGDCITIPSETLQKKYIPEKEIVKVGYRRSPTLTTSSLQQEFCIFVENTPLGGPTRGFLCALLAGDRQMLDFRLRSSFAATGLSHLLAVSGMHVGIMVGIIFWLLKPLNFVGGWKIRRMSTIPLVWMFALFSGFGAPAVRTSLMLTLTFLAYIWERRRSGANGAVIAAFIILLFDPSSLTDIGFQFSFLCVFCLIAFASPLNTLDHRSHPILYRLTAALLLPLIATFGTWVLSSYHFGQVALGFMPLNLIAVPLLPIYLVVALLYLLLFFFGVEIRILGDLLDFSLEGLVRCAEWLTADGSTVIEMSIPGWFVILWIGLLSISAWLINHPLSFSDKH